MSVNYLGIRSVKKLIREVFSLKLAFYDSYKRYGGNESITCYNSEYDFAFSFMQYKCGNVWIFLEIHDVNGLLDYFVLELMPDHKTFSYPDNYESVLSHIKNLLCNKLVAVSERYVSVYKYKDIDICVLRRSFPAEGDNLGYVVDHPHLKGIYYDDISDALSAIDNI